MQNSQAASNMSILTTEMVKEYAIRPGDVRRTNSRAKGVVTTLRNEETESRDIELPRSASYTYMGDARSKDSSSLSLDKSSFSETDLTTPGDNSVDISPTDSTGVNTPDERFAAAENGGPKARELIFELRKVPQVAVRPVSRGKSENGSQNIISSRTESSNSEARGEIASANGLAAHTTSRARKSVTSNFSRKLSRRSWMASKSSDSSRSSSPHKKENQQVLDTVATSNEHSSAPVSPVAEKRQSLPKRNEISRPQKKADDNDDRPVSGDEDGSGLTLRSSVLRKKRSVSGLFKGSTNSEDKPVSPKPTKAATQVETLTNPETAIVQDAKPKRTKTKRQSLLTLPKSFSTEKLPHYPPSPISPRAPTPVPRLLSSDRVAKGGFIAPKKKDELWSVFRGLDADFSKFNSKSVAFKANVVRTSLLPFLRTYSTHASNKRIRAEDLDRRANILNKWWTGLIELLHGRNNQSISGTDRPAILDGIAGIMERPEWRLPPSPLSPLNQRLRGTASPLNRSTTSLGSEASDFLTESIHHNVRNIFIQNLSAQMAFVVDKMSLRNASASLVSFCGKACAYAFMFVPGMADVLVRLWDIHISTVQRVLEGNGIGKFDKLSDTGASIASGFPPALQQLGFTSLMKYMRTLRTPPPLPLGTSNIQWWGRWLDRWSGRESDLFYVFVKYFHILATEFLPSDSSRRERMCAPGFLLVHAQVLTNMDATIHRDANQAQHDPGAGGTSASFDDMFGDPDAVATTLPLLPINATRLMSENRLIMLIRDFLSERAAEHPAARRIFAESFNNLLQTAARGTSMFDHAACYTLLDFLEEAMVLLVRVEHITEGDEPLVDIDFWMLVWKKMIESQNTMTEIRLYAFLYTVWNTVISDLGRKRDLCSNLLLDPAVFSSQFNHWCPMVRAYFMRLLCWRVGRVDGEYSENDLVMLELLLERLQVTFSQYLFLREQARIQDTQSPATNPCNPAPSRRLLIIRTDPLLTAPGKFLSFDGIVEPRTITDATPMALKRSSTISSISNVMELRTRPDSSLSVSSDSTDMEPRGRTIGGFIRNLIGSGSKSRAKSQSRSPAKPAAEVPPIPQPGNLLRAATDEFHGPTQPSAPPTNAPAAQQTPPFQPYSFKFSLEYHSNARPLPPMRLLPPRVPLPAHQMLQTYSPKVQTPTLPKPLKPEGDSVAQAKYSGRALAEWAVVLGECQSFFERRKSEGVPGARFVETPALGVEVFRRPG